MWQSSALDVPLAGFAVILLVSAAASPYRGVAIEVTTILVLSGVIYFGSFMWLLSRAAGARTALFYAWVLGALVAALAGLLYSASSYSQIGAHTWIHARAEIPRGVGPNGLGTTLLLGTILASGLAFRVRGWTLVGLSACASLTFVGLLATGSRASLAGLIIGTAYLVYRELRTRPVLMVSVLAGGAVALVLASAVTPQLHQRLRDTVTDVSGNRIRIWRTSLSMIRRHPVLGTGFGTFETEYERRKAPGMSPEPFAFNLALNIAVETGLVGFLGACWIGVAAVRAWWQQGRRAPPLADPMRSVIAALWVGLLVDQLADNTLFSVSTSAALWLMLALLVASPPRRYAGSGETSIP